MSFKFKLNLNASLQWLQVLSFAVAQLAVWPRSLFGLCLVKFEQIPLFCPRGCAAPLRGIAAIATLERFVRASRLYRPRPRARPRGHGELLKLLRKPAAGIKVLAARSGRAAQAAASERRGGGRRGPPYGQGRPWHRLPCLE